MQKIQKRSIYAISAILCSFTMAQANASGGTQVWIGQTLTAPGVTTADGFGQSVAMSGSTAVVGSYGETIQGHTFQGAAYVYTESNGVWKEVAKLTASNGQAADLFGWSVAVSGDTILVGAMGSSSQQGAVYVFTKPVGGWKNTANFAAELTASDGATNDAFGWSVALDGDTALIGATGHSGNKGEAYIFEKPGGGWVTTSTFDAEITASDVASGDNFGYSVSLSGNTALIGGRNHSVSGQTGQGAAYVYLRPISGWASTTNFDAELTSSDGTAGDHFGNAVGLSPTGGTALIGAPDHAVGGHTSQGAAYVFTKPVGGWTSASAEDAEFTIHNGDTDDRMGYSVATSDSSALVGVPGHLENGSFAGAAYAFVAPAGGWVSTSKGSAELVASDGTFLDYFGNAVALDGANAFVTKRSATSAGMFGTAKLQLLLDVPSAAKSGAQYTSQVTVTNTSVSDTPDLKLSVSVPIGTDLASVSETQGQCVQAAGLVNCDFGVISASGGRASASLVLNVTSTQQFTVLTNQVRLTATPMIIVTHGTQVTGTVSSGGSGDSSGAGGGAAASAPWP